MEKNEILKEIDKLRRYYMRPETAMWLTDQFESPVVDTSVPTKEILHERARGAETALRKVIEFVKSNQS